MGYIEDNLTSNEKVIFKTRLHWIVLIKPILWIIVAIILFSAPLAEFGTVLGVISVILALYFGLSGIANYFTSEFGVTDQRVMIKTGYLHTKTIETLLTKIEAIEVTQTLFGKGFGYGSILITGSGGSKSKFHHIDSPLEFRQRIQEMSVEMQK